jgi:hypothetical protein
MTRLAGYILVFFSLSCTWIMVRAADRLPAPGDSVDAALNEIHPEAIRADMRFLADDLLEGRGTGTRGHEIAARFVASRFEADGLEPAGENGTYYQSVPLRSFRPDEKQSTLTLVLGGKEETLTFREDFLTQGDPVRKETSVEAGIVYVGQGVTAPELGYDDYKGIDANGKIVAFIFGTPSTFSTTLRAHYSSREEKAANAVAHGAVGLIVLDSPALENVYSFKERVRDLVFPSLRWLSPEGKPNDHFEELRAVVELSMAGVSKILAGTGKTPEELYRAAQESRPLSFALQGTLKAREVTQLADLRSPNVVARLRGSDPALCDEYVVYTAHLDHLGIGQPVDGDSIYNGAIDNAAGTASLLEIARAYGRMNPRPRRSFLFVSVTGEESGLLGSDYFAHYPTVPQRSLVAEVNMDGDLLLWPLEDVIVNGEEHSTLGNQVHQAALRLHLLVSPDPFPEQVFFIRSDQYSFVRQGVPVVDISNGMQSSDAKIHPRETLLKWIDTVYHSPKDDMNQPFDFEAAAAYSRYSYLLGFLVAQEAERPEWKPGDFFGEKYGKK